MSNYAEIIEQNKSVKEVGVKHDSGKPRVGFMLEQFSKALTEVAKVSTFGAEKYGAGNWQHVEQERYIDALGRHLLASGTNDDTGLSHKAHAAWNALAVLELELRETSVEKRKHLRPEDYTNVGGIK